MRYLFLSLIFWSCTNKVIEVQKPIEDDIANPYVIVEDPNQFETMDKSFTFKFKCYTFNAPQWKTHRIKCWRLITDEGYELIDTNLTEEHERVDLKFEKSGGHWIGVTCVQENGNIGHELIHILTR